MARKSRQRKPHTVQEERPSTFGHDALDQARRILDNLSSSVFVGTVTMKGKLTYANRAALDAVGARLEDVVGRSVELTPWFAQSESNRQQWRSAFHSAVTGDLANFEFSFKDIDGVLRTMDLTLQPAPNKSGDLANNVFTAHDITERKRVETMLGLTNFAIERARIALVQVDVDGRVCSVNDFACTLLDYSRDALLGMRVERLSSNVARHGWIKVWNLLQASGFLQYETTFIRADGRKIPVELYLSCVKYDGREHAFIFINDITERKSAEEHIHFLAHFDELTRLPNRVSFLDIIGRYVHRGEYKRSKIAVAIADVERFWIINNTLGRQASDKLLTQIADRFVGYAEGGNRLARIGADQFALIITDVNDQEQAEVRIERKLAAIFALPFEIEEHHVRISAKFGIAMYPEAGTDAETLLRHAEIALNRAKETAEKYLFYTAGMLDRATDGLKLETKLRGALDRAEFTLHYQPKVNLASRRIEGCEALLRWEDRETGMVSPVRFVPILEKTGLILEVGSWALRQAAQDYRNWREQGLVAPRIAVNVSVIQLRKRNFVQILEHEIACGEELPGIDLEITETAVMEDIDDNIEKLKAIRAMGVQIGIDDFGTGYSSLAYLTKLPVQTVKIDRSFICTMLDDEDKKTLISGIISLAHALRLKVVAEGVETSAQEEALRSLGCDLVQGYRFSKPMPAQELSGLLDKYK